MTNLNVVRETRAGDQHRACQESGEMAKQGKLDPVTTDLLRRTHFMGKPLLVNDPIMSMSAVAYPGDSPTAQDFAAFHPNIGHLTAKDGRRQDLYLRLNKMSMVTKAYEKQSPPRGPTPPIGEWKEPPEYQPFSKAAVTTPAIWPANDALSKSGLFTTPPNSPVAPKGRFPETTTRQAPARTSTYEAYRPTITVSQPKLTSPTEAAMRSLKHARANIAYKPYKGKPLPRPILTASVQDADYNFIDMLPPEPSPSPSLSPSPPGAAPSSLLSSSSSSSSSDRNFSFDANAPADWQIIYASSTQSRSPPSHNSSPRPKDLTLRDGQAFIQQTSADELYFAPIPSQPSPNLTTISPRVSLVESPEILDITELEHMHTEPRVPQPTTRFYGSAIYAHGRFLSRRKTPRGTIKLRSHASVEGEAFEMKEWIEPRYEQAKVTERKREECRVL